MPVTGKFSNTTRLAFFSVALASLPMGAVAQEAAETVKAVEALKANPLNLEEGSVEEASRNEAVSREAASQNEGVPLARGRKEPLGEDSSEDAATRQPTEITASKETNFDEKSRKVVFIGNVVVKDPEFHLSCERLTVFLKKGDEKNEPAAPQGEGGGLERVIAEGKVIIFQEKPDDKGKITRYVGKAAKAEYNAVTGDVTLSGWPQIQQGINNQVATEEGTVMILNRNGRMQTVGASKTVIAESSESPKRGGGKRHSSSTGSNDAPPLR